MKEYFGELNEVLNNYTFGDLFEAMQAVELCDRIITEESIPQPELAKVQDLKSILESIILQGSSDEKEQALLRIKANLAGEASVATEEATSGSAESQPSVAASISADDLLSRMGGNENATEEHFDDLLSKMSGGEADAGQEGFDTLLSQMQDSAPAAGTPSQAPASAPAKEAQSLIITVDDGETLNSFVSESTEHLDSVETLIINLEATHDHDTVNAIFRAMHTIKGVSGFMGFAQITQLSHKLENLLDALRSEEITFSADLIDILLAGSDILRAMMNTLAPIAARYATSEESFNVEFPVFDIDTTINNVERYMSGHAVNGAQTPAPAEPAPVNTTAAVPVAPTPVEPAFSSPQLSAVELNEYAFAAKTIFQNLKRSLMLLQDNINNQAALKEITTEIETLDTASRKMGVSEICDLCELITNKIKRSTEGYPLSYSDLFSGLKTLTDAFKARMTLLKQAAGLPLPDAEEEAAVSIESLQQPEPVKPASTPTAASSAPATAVAPSAVDAKKPETKPTAAKTVAAAQPAAGDPEATTVRVDIKKMDKLFNMIGELITAQDILLDQFNDEESQEIQKAKSHLEKVTREIQELSMQLRMVTLNALFNKMKRIARDLSRKLGKEVNFNIYGQDTEMDRNVIDEISDPLMHIIRNALDHGLEDAETRKAAGKSPVGNITLGAGYEGNGIVISVKDDGAGLNKEKILKKAIQNSLVSEEEAQTMPERKIFDLIMAPGFSTSETVSDISGRGVGMDVVKRSIDSLRGSVSVISKEGKGSEFRIRIPLTLAIIDAITFRIGTLTLATQITDVVEFYKAREDQITVTQSQGKVLNLRGELIPILEVSNYYKIEHQYTRYEDGIVIVASSNNKKVAIVVDEIIGNKHLVIKPLPPVFSHISSLSGCSILAGGETCLIVDMNRLLGQILDLT